MSSISVKGDTNVHGGAPFDTGLSSNVFAGNLPVAVATQTGSTSKDSRGHGPGNQKANQGSPNVFVNNKPVHRVGDARIDGATAGPGISSVKVN
jgi:uncharacterized Zn-binding protein involved in type VI secretion